MSVLPATPELIAIAGIWLLTAGVRLQVALNRGAGMASAVRGRVRRFDVVIVAVVAALLLVRA